MTLPLSNPGNNYKIQSSYATVLQLSNGSTFQQCMCKNAGNEVKLYISVKMILNNEIKTHSTSHMKSSSSYNNKKVLNHTCFNSATLNRFIFFNFFFDSFDLSTSTGFS